MEVFPIAQQPKRSPQLRPNEVVADGEYTIRSNPFLQVIPDA